MTTRYYRIDYPEAMDAWRAFRKEAAALRAAANDFAAQYPNAKARMSHSVHGLAFAGLEFSPPCDSPLWTKPNRKYGNIQQPRSALPRQGIADRKAAAIELGALRAKYLEHRPTTNASTDAFWKSIGTDWGNLLFGGIAYVEHGEAMYVATSATLDPRAIEITGGEYEAARVGAA